MAPRLSWWVGGTIAACGLVAAAFLPPRGLETLNRVVFVRVPYREVPRSAAQERANQLESQWKQVDGQLRGALYRQQAAAELAARRARGEQGPLLIVDPDSAVPDGAPLIRAAVDSAWHQLKLHDPKVDLVVAIPNLRNRGTGSALRTWHYMSNAYLLPDSTDRTTCVAIMPVFWGSENRRTRPWELESWARNRLGPCAFFAQFGAPSPRMWRWLDANSFDVAEVSDWSDKAYVSSVAGDDDFVTLRGTFYWFVQTYGLPFNTIACLAGRMDACSSAIKNGDSESTRPVRNVVIPARGWRDADARIASRESFLASVYKKVGEDAFQEFWTTTLPVDSALTVALGEPAAQWSQQWQLGGRPAPRIGAAPPLSGALLALLVAAVAVALSAWATRFRQVR